MTVHVVGHISFECLFEREGGLIEEEGGLNSQFLTG